MRRAKRSENQTFSGVQYLCLCSIMRSSRSHSASAELSSGLAVIESSDQPVPAARGLLGPPLMCASPPIFFFFFSKIDMLQLQIHLRVLRKGNIMSFFHMHFQTIHFYAFCNNFTLIYSFKGCICSYIARLMPLIHLPRDFWSCLLNITLLSLTLASFHHPPPAVYCILTISDSTCSFPSPHHCCRLPVHPVLSAAQPAPPLPVLLCQLFSSRLLTKQGIHIGKMPPKIWPVVTVIIESGVAFPTKCHCCNASPHYRAGRIDHLYDACVVTEPHVDTQTLRMCSPLVLL